MNAKLEKLINGFLYDKRKSDGDGYAEITDGDVEYLYKIIGMLVELKFEPDADGDYPIDYEITDLTKYERSNFMQVPRWLLVDGIDYDNSEILRRYAINLSIAADRIKIYSDVVGHRTGKIKK